MLLNVTISKVIFQINPKIRLFFWEFLSVWEFSWILEANRSFCFWLACRIIARTHDDVTVEVDLWPFGLKNGAKLSSIRVLITGWITELQKKTCLVSSLWPFKLISLSLSPKGGLLFSQNSPQGAPCTLHELQALSTLSRFLTQESGDVVVDLVSVGCVVKLKVDVGAEIVLGAEHLKTLGVERHSRKRHVDILLVVKYHYLPTCWLYSPVVWARAVSYRFSWHCGVWFESPVPEMIYGGGTLNSSSSPDWGVSVYPLGLPDIHWGAGSRGFHQLCKHGPGWTPEEGSSPRHTPCEASQLHSESFTAGSLHVLIFKFYRNVP